MVSTTPSFHGLRTRSFEPYQAEALQRSQQVSNDPSNMALPVDYRCMHQLRQSLVQRKQPVPALFITRPDQTRIQRFAVVNPATSSLVWLSCSRRSDRRGGLARWWQGMRESGCRRFDWETAYYSTFPVLPAKVSTHGGFLRFPVRLPN